MLHLERIYDFHDLSLLDYVSILVGRAVGRHFKLLDLVEPLVNFARFVHEVLQFGDEEHMVLLDPFAHQWQ